MSFEENGPCRIGRQEIRRNHVPSFNFHARNEAERKDIVETFD